MRDSLSIYPFRPTASGRGGSRVALAALLFIGSLCLTLAAATTGRAQGGLPPLIDRQLFFGDPEISGAQISPDGQYISFIKPFKGTRNIWVKRAGEPFSAARPITNDTKRPIPGYFWTWDSRYILFTQDQGGNENFNVYAVNPAEQPAAGQDVPKARNLTEAQNVRAQIYDVPREEPDIMYVGLNDRDPAWHDLYRVKISTGERTLLRKNTERFTGWVFDNKGQLRLATRSADNGDTEVLRVDDNGFTKVYTCNVFETCAPVRFNKENKRVYMITNRGDATDLAGLTLFDPATGKEELIESDPMKRVDLNNVLFSEVTDEPIATIYTDEKRRLYWKDKGYEADYKLLQSKLPGRQINFNSSTRNERVYIISANGDTEPGEVYMFDRDSKKLTLQYRVREKLPREALAEMQPITYTSSDGMQVPAYLTLPKGVAPRNLPLLVVPHGGPWARDNWGYNSFAQFFANRGYAVLMPNFRGSTGYGKRFINAGNNEWGQKMQDDLTWGVKYLVSKGIADPKRVGIMGGSYGGYATLAGVTFTPDLYAAAVAYVAPSNLITLLNSIPPYWESIRMVFNKRMGDPKTPEGRAQLERQSPLNFASKIKTPLMVVQGANDPRVKRTESDQIVIALRERGYPVDYIVAPDEGHGFQRPVNNMAMFAAAEKFLAKYLGGRYQEDMTPDVAQRLKEITVDVKTVEMPRTVLAASVGVPKPAVDLKPGKSSYKGTIAVAGQNIPMTVTTEIREESGAWVINESAQLPMGTISDIATLEKGSLVLRKRSIKQGPVAVDLEFANGKATGTLNMNGQSKPVDVSLDGALFADGAGAFDVVATLPLAPGYTTSYRNFDVRAQQVSTRQLKVVGMESVTVPAGTFEAYKVEISNADGSDKTYVWVAKDTRRVVKTSSTVAAMNGAVITTELTE